MQATIHNIPDIEVNLEEIIDFYFEQKYGLQEICWMDEEINEGTLLLTDVDVRGSHKAVVKFMDEFDVDAD